MLTRLFLLIVILGFPFCSFSQEESLLTALFIPSDLAKNSNAVVRMDDINIEINAFNRMVYTNKRIVTILNSSGDSEHGAIMYYDDLTNIKKLDVKIYDSFGNEIKRIRKNDFEDVSAVSGGTLYSDSRVKYLNYAPLNYPYTVVLETEVHYGSTAFIPSWRPIEGYYTATQNASYKIINNSQVPIRVKASNFEEYQIERLHDYHYSATNLRSIKPESFSPDFSAFAPFLKATLTQFEMEGVKGENKDWQEFGKWMNDKLIKGTRGLPEQVKSDIKALTANAITDIEKAKIVYKYVQDKTRYISVQVGIGGWKPMLASDVDRLGYGDCKGLSNYTKALLDEVGVESYYAIIYGDKSIRNIDNSFSSTQGNHAVLCIPHESEYIWLECTSQTAPFGYSANFTDDRDALIITPEGGKIVHTKIYKTEENLLETNASIVVNDQGGVRASIKTKSLGTQFGYHQRVQDKTLKDQHLHYKEYWSYINNLEIDSILHNNNKDKVVFTENLVVKADRYASKAGYFILFQPNLFNRLDSAPQRYDVRHIPFEIERGFTNFDEYEIIIPEIFEVEALMTDVLITNQFGEYSASIGYKDNNKLFYNRKFIIYKGSYKKEDYAAFREFLLEVVKSDNAKIVLKTKI